VVSGQLTPFYPRTLYRPQLGQFASRAVARLSVRQIAVAAAVPVAIDDRASASKSGSITADDRDARCRSGRQAAVIGAGRSDLRQTPARRPIQQRRGRRRWWLLRHASESLVRLQIIAHRAASKHIRGSRKSRQSRAPRSRWRRSGEPILGRRLARLARSETSRLDRVCFACRRDAHAGQSASPPVPRSVPGSSWGDCRHLCLT